MRFQIVLDALTNIVTDIVNFIPNLVNGLIILLVGYLVAVVVRWLVVAVLRRLRFDELADRSGLTGALRGLSVETPLSKIGGQAVFALLLLSFLITSARLMGLLPVAQLFERLLAFIPSLIAAAIVFLLGGVVAQKVGAVAASASLAAGVTNGRRLGRILQYVISVFVVILALGVMGMDTSLLITAVMILIAAFGLALGLALGLGARGVVHHVLAGYYVRQNFPVGAGVEVGEIAGEVASVGGVSTVLTTGGGSSVVVSNGSLLDVAVRATTDGRRPAGAEDERRED